MLNQVTYIKRMVLNHLLCYREESLEKPVVVTEEDFNIQHLVNSGKFRVFILGFEASVKSFSKEKWGVAEYGLQQC